MADKAVAAVHTLGRRLLAVESEKLAQHVVDFNALSTGQGRAALTLPRVDEAYIALGTTIKVAGSRAAFRAVDLDAVVAVATAARTAGAMRLGVVSAMGASPRSSLFYSRVKGEMENALSGLGFATLVIARPSMLAGDRESLGQPRRGGETLAVAVTRWLAPLVPDHYKSIDAHAVAAALLSAVPLRQGLQVLQSGEMRRAVPLPAAATA